MVDLDLDLDKSAVSAKLEQLKQKIAGDPVYVVTVGAEYAVYLEFGRGPIEAPEGSAIPIKTDDGDTIFRKRVSGHPPYPFFRPAIREFEANPETFIEDNSDMGLDEIETAEDLVTAVSSSLERKIKQNVTAQSASGRSSGTHPDHPKVQTGNLRQSIRVVRVN